MPSSHHRHGQVKTRQSCLVRVGGVNWLLIRLNVVLERASGRNITSVRIELLDTGEFRLDGEKPGSHLLPSSPCVLDLLRQHIVDGGVGRRQFVLLDGSQPCRETPLFLQRPLYRDPYPATLKHLCRRRIHSSLEGRGVDRLHLVPSLKQYLKEYPSDI